MKLVAVGLSDGVVATKFGCSRSTIRQLRGRDASPDRVARDRVLQTRVSAAEAAAFETIVADAGTTASKMLRQMIRLSAGAAEFRTDELAELRTTTTQLNALARNLVQILKLGHAGRLHWNARDAAQVERLLVRTEAVSRSVQAMRAASMRGAFVTAGAVPNPAGAGETRDG